MAVTAVPRSKAVWLPAFLVARSSPSNRRGPVAAAFQPGRQVGAKLAGTRQTNLKIIYDRRCLPACLLSQLRPNHRPDQSQRGATPSRKFGLGDFTARRTTCREQQRTPGLLCISPPTSPVLRDLVVLE